MINKIQLENGLNVIFKQSRKSPVVSVQMWVKTGSADEGLNEEGISHFIEHLVFKGTKKYGLGEIASSVEGAGGMLNAYTSFDETVFYVTLSSEYLDLAVDVIKEMMFCPLFDSTEIDNEREVVIEEIKRGKDNPHRIASQQMFSNQYPTHGYGKPVIGYEENIKRLSVEEIKDYFSRRYTPDNMSLLVVGDFDDIKEKEIVEIFSKLRLEEKSTPVVRPKEKFQTKKIDILETPFKENFLNVCWPIPNVKSEDIPALDMLAMILGQGENSRLMQATRIKKPLANYTVTSSFTPKDCGFFALSTSFSLDKMDELLKEIIKEIKQFYIKGIEEKELNRIKVSFQSSESYSLETVDGLSKSIGMYENLFNDPNYHHVFTEAMLALTEKDVMRVFYKYLDPENMNIYLMYEKEQVNKEDITRSLETFQNLYQSLFLEKKHLADETNQFKKTNFKKPRQTKDSKKIIIESSSGSKMILIPNYDTDVISLKLGSLGGLWGESIAGQSQLFSQLWGTATEEKDEKQISEILEINASSVSSFSGRNTQGLSFKTLVPYQDVTFSLFKEVLLTPKFDSTILEREKYYIEEKRKKRADNPAQVLFLNLMSEFFKGHVYGEDLLGSIDSISSLNNINLQEFKQSYIGSNNLVVTCVGAFDVNDYQDKIEALFQDLNRVDIKNIADKKFQYLTEDKNISIPLEKEQTHLAIVYPGLTFTDNEQYTLQIIQSLLSGQGGRLFMELRDKASLAYSVSPIRFDGINAGYFGGYIACSPEKRETARIKMIEEFMKLAETNILEKELEKAKKNVLGVHDIELQRNGTIANFYLFNKLYQQGIDDFKEYHQKIKLVSAEDVRKLAQRLFNQPKLTMSVGIN